MRILPLAVPLALLVAGCLATPSEPASTGSVTPTTGADAPAEWTREVRYTPLTTILASSDASTVAHAAVVGRNVTLTLLDLESGRERWNLTYQTFMCCGAPTVDLSDDGQRVAAAGAMALLFSDEPTRPDVAHLYRHRGGVIPETAVSLDANADGSLVATTTWEAGHVYAFSPQHGLLWSDRISASGDFSAVSVAPDGSSVVTATPDDVRVYDAATGRLLESRPVGSNETYVPGVAMGGDGGLYAAFSRIDGQGIVTLHALGQEDARWTLAVGDERGARLWIDGEGEWVIASAEGRGTAWVADTRDASRATLPDEEVILDVRPIRSQDYALARSPDALVLYEVRGDGLHVAAQVPAGTLVEAAVLTPRGILVLEKPTVPGNPGDLKHIPLTQLHED